MSYRIRTAALILLGLALGAPRGAGAVTAQLSGQAAARAVAVSAPTLDADGVVQASTDQPVTIQATATDSDASDILTISATGYPVGLAFSSTPSVSPATATLSGTPGLADVGSWSINWSVSDGTGGTASATTSLTVIGNQPPEVSAPSSVNGAETIHLSVTAIVSDPDGDPVNSFTASPLPPGATFALNAVKTTGLFEWTPPLGSQGTYSVTFTADTGSPSRTSSATTTLNIGPKDNPPVITAPGTTNGRTTWPLSILITVSDPDGDPISTLDIEGTQGTELPAGSSVTINASNTSATFSWTPAPDQIGNYGINIIAISRLLQVSKQIRVVVAADSPPVVIAPASVSGTENVPFTFTVSASDPDGASQPIASLTAAPLPMGASFTVNASNTAGTFAWTPDYSQAGSYSVAFSATNHLSGSAATSITVANVDRTPLVTAPATAGGPEGSTITFLVTATDPDGEAIASLSAIGLPPGATFLPGLDHSSGTFAWVPAFSQAGSYAVTFVASNAMSATATTTIAVTDQNRAPVADAGGPYTGVAGLPVSFNGTASSDPDGDALTYAWDFGDMMTGSGATPSHTYAAAGAYTATLAVTDNGVPALIGIDTATANIAASFDARVFTTNANKAIRLGSGKPRWCAQVEPVGGDFSLGEIDPGSVVLRYGAGQVSADAGKGFETGDKDGNGVPDLTVCFAKADLRTLFAGLPTGQNDVTVTIEATLASGAKVSGSVGVDVFGSGAALAATVTPNPLNPEAVLSFRTERGGPLQVRLYDVNGRLIRTLREETSAAAGYHDIRVDGRGAHGESLPSGTYFFRIVSADGESAGRLTVLK